jgi:phospholipase C
VSTILDEMDAASVSWNIYAATTAEANSSQCVNLSAACGYIWSACPSFADCLDTSESAHLVESSRFFTDAASGGLPSVSFVMPAGGGNLAFAQHNDESNAAGDNWIGKIASAVMNGPDWSSTALIITYDDCGCFYDQLAPPLAPDGSRMGIRVPFVVVSPYARPDYTDSTATSSTGSILAFIEHNFRLPALGPDDTAADNLAGMFNFSQPPRRTVLHMAWRHLPRSACKVTRQTADDDT